MKLQRLHLKAFGAFSDRVLDLSGGTEGLHLIHGPNEAGKSTTLRAITQLLYGIDTKTSDAFLHPMQNLRIGASLSNGGENLSFYRRKGNKATLLAADEKTPLPDDALRPFMGSVDLDAFRNLFGLTHEQLVQGGQALVQGEGDVGQALFSAAAGMGNLRALVAKLDNDAGELFKPSAAKPRINNALAQLAAARKAVKAAQLSSRDWDALESARKSAEERRAAIDLELRQARADLTRLRAIQEALPLVSQRAALLEMVAPFVGAVLLDEGFQERRLNCQNTALNARETLALATQAIASLQGERDPFSVNEALLAREEEIKELYERHGANKKAMTDLERERTPELLRVRADAERTLAHLRPHWTLEQAEDLRLAPGQKQRLQELTRRGESCRTAVSHAAAAREKLLRQREQAARDLALLGNGADTGMVERALKRAQKSGDGESQLHQQRAAIDGQREGIVAGIARLGRWGGSMEALEALPVPEAATIERYRVELDGAARALAGNVQQAVVLADELRQAEADLETYQRQYQAPSLDALETLRRSRQEGWNYARTAWEAAIPPDRLKDARAVDFVSRIRAHYPAAGNLADAFAALVDDSDNAADRLRNEAEHVARRAQLESTVALLREKQAALQLVHKELQDCSEAIAQAWRTEWQPAGIAPLSPVEMAEWKAKHETLLQEMGALRANCKAQEALQATLEENQVALLDTLRAGGTGEWSDAGSLASLIDRAETWVERQRASTQQRAHLEKTIAQLDSSGVPEADAALARAREDEAAWRADWSSMMDLLGARQEASPDEALAIVDSIEEILAGHEKALELQQRIDAILRDDTEFRKDLHRVAAEVGHDTTDSVPAIVAALYHELQRSREAQTTVARIAQQLREEEERQRTAEAALTRAEAELGALCAEAGVDSPAALPEAEKASTERRRLEASRHDIDLRLFALFPGQGMEAIIAMVAAEDATALAPALEALGEHIEDLDDERLALQESIGEVKTKLALMNGGSQAADAAEEAQALIAGIAEDAAEYARLRVAAYTLNRAIEHYRAANQEPLLARAGEIFQTLTLGSFKELRADVDDRDRHVLLGVREQNGALVGVTGMSEGTADQLYLALRIASLERHLERHAPIPFILDDILVNFDDARAAAALEVLAALSDRTQVIYFTHHQHLVELAKAKVGNATLFVHELGG